MPSTARTILFLQLLYNYYKYLLGNNNSSSHISEVQSSQNELSVKPIPLHDVGFISQNVTKLQREKEKNIVPSKEMKGFFRVFRMDFMASTCWSEINDFSNNTCETHTHTHTYLGTRNATHHVSKCWMSPGGTWDLVHMFSASIFIITPWCSLTHPKVETLKSLDVIVSSRIVASHLVGRNTTYIIPSHLANLLLNLSMWVLVAGPLGCRWPESLFDVAWNGLPVSRQVKWKGIPLPQWFWRSGMPQCPIVRLCVWFHKEGGIKQFVSEMLETPVQKYWKVYIHTKKHYMRL